jgi:hypothetical protein
LWQQLDFVRSIMSSYWDSYTTHPSRRLCDVCHYYGHWSYECNFSPQYSTTTYNAQWEEPSFSQGYENYRGAAYDQNFQPSEFYQPSQYHQVQNEDSTNEKLDKMISLLKEMEEMSERSRQRQEEHTKWFDQQMSHFHAPIEEIEEDEHGPDFQIQDSSRLEVLYLPKQSPVADEQNFEPEAENLNFPNQYPNPEPIKPIYTELDYILEFDNFSEVDETELLVREHEDIDSTQEDVEMDTKGDGDDFDGVELSDNEIERAVKCLHHEEKVSSMETTDDLVKRGMFDLPLNKPTYASNFPILRTSLEHHKLWPQDTVNPSRKGWDSRLNDNPLVLYKAVDDLVGKSSQELVYWGFYHLPFKLKDPSDCFKKNMAMHSGKCEEMGRSRLFGFEDDRLDAPEIITWYKDRGKFFPQHHC